MPEGDVATTLGALEQKLRRLEDELQGRPPAPVAEPRPLAPAASPPAAVGGGDQLAELLRFRDQLERASRALTADFERVIGALGVMIDATVATPATARLDDTVLSGAILVEAGPFTDVGTLSGFEQALGAVPGVQDVRVRGVEGSRALIDVTLAQPVALGAELVRGASTPLTVTAAGAGRLVVTVGPPA